VYTTTTTGLVRARRSQVYAALLDPAAVATWRVPDGMTAEVHEWEPHEGGRFRVSLTYAGGEEGKSGVHTDSYAGHFSRLVPDEEVVEVLAFETGDPALTGEMTISTRLRDADGGTEVEMVHEGVPDAVDAEQNAEGSRMAMANLTDYVESRVAG
jgi:uncharacterized protein YndB with AHSA1/START domain